jgi:hypothetical protein
MKMLKSELSSNLPAEFIAPNFEDPGFGINNNLPS